MLENMFGRTSAV